MTEFLMPSLGADMEAATLVSWQVKPGDSVKRGDVVATVETAKGIIDIEIFADGVIDTLIAKAGDEVPVGAAIARYRTAGETAAPPASEPPTPTTPAAAAAERAAPARPTGEAVPQPRERTLASPAARRRATELGVELATITPRPAGAITVQDVERAAEQRAAPAVKAGAGRDMRTLIADTMSRSKREIPHYYLATPVDMRTALRWLEQHNAAHTVTERLHYGVLLIKAVARALERFPELNGFWRNGRFDAAQDINVGTAIRLRRGGLVAPALQSANQQPLPVLMRAFQDLVLRARTGGLRATELSSATITVSSLGEGGVDTVYPIIHSPQVAIVGFGAITTRPWCVGDAVVAAPVVSATLSADHRVSDGHRGSEFLIAVAEALQHPELL